MRFEGNSPKRWDGKVAEVPTSMATKTGRIGDDGLPQAEVHWPGKGKGKDDLTSDQAAAGGKNHVCAARLLAPGLYTRT